MTVKSSWVVVDGWAWPEGRTIPKISPRIEAKPSLRGKPPCGAHKGYVEKSERQRPFRPAKARHI